MIMLRPGLTGQEDKMKKSARTPSFGLHNSTDKWVLIVDDYFGYFDSQDALNMPLFADVERCVAWTWLER